MANKLVGQNYQTPDLIAKVTGRAKYADDYKVDGMLHARLLTSPLPHARARNIDVSRALALPGVKGASAAGRDSQPGRHRHRPWRGHQGRHAR